MDGEGCSQQGGHLGKEADVWRGAVLLGNRV